MNQTQTPLLTSRFEQALVYATRLHAKQLRKETQIPYISHLLSVAALVLEDGGNENQAIAALLHDAIEDQGGERTRQEIRHQFGSEVAEIVEGCTDADVIPKPPWRERKQRYLEQFRQATPEVRRVSLADKLHNARSIEADYRKMPLLQRLLPLARSQHRPLWVIPRPQRQQFPIEAGGNNYCPGLVSLAEQSYLSNFRRRLAAPSPLPSRKSSNPCTSLRVTCRKSKSLSCTPPSDTIELTIF